MYMKKYFSIQVLTILSFCDFLFYFNNPNSVIVVGERFDEHMIVLTTSLLPEDKWEKYLANANNVSVAMYVRGSAFLCTQEAHLTQVIFCSYHQNYFHIVRTQKVTFIVSTQINVNFWNINIFIVNL